MARGINHLSHKQIQAAAGPVMLHDGGGLYLQVTAAGNKSWIFRHAFAHRVRDMGLGPLRDVSLAEARVRADEARRKVREGIDPIADRDDARRASEAVPLFGDAADAYINDHSAEWTNAKHADQWQSTIDTYAKPVLGAVRVDHINVDHVLGILRPIWSSKTETATRVRQRIEVVIDAAYAKHNIDKRNPARWHGLLDKLLAKPRKVTPVEHFPAMPYQELPAFMRALRAKPAISRRAIEFTILTAARTNMVTGARREEIRDGVWYVPRERMKGGRPFEVPLSAVALAVVESIPVDGSFIFQSWAGAIGNGAMLSMMKYLGRGDLTVHGFRSSFRDWAGNEVAYPREVIEEAMAHHIKDKAEAAYRRGAALSKRRGLMEEWAAFLAGSE